MHRSTNNLRPVICAALLAMSALSIAAPYDNPPDLTTLPMEQLLRLEVYSASKFTQKVSEAPSAVSIVTAADIKAYGYRTLADILKSIPGLYVRYDRNYSYLGIRGFARPGDYNNRVLLLIDGYKTNDGVYDGALLGTEFPLDVDLIDRVEFVPGPGSAVYGSNAVFGVINVITKRGADIGGTEVSGELASFGTQKARVTYGHHDENGLETLLSASGYHSRGQDLFFPEFNDPATNNGVAQGLDHDRYDQVFTKTSAGPYTLEVGFSKRTKGIPTASFGQVFDQPGSQTTDQLAFLDLKYYTKLSADLGVSAALFSGQYGYDGHYNFAPPTVNMDGSRSKWWGGELQFLNTALARHKLIYGVEYRDDYEQRQFNFDDAPRVTYLDDLRSERSYGVYVQDEFTLSDTWLLNAGVRYDGSTANQHVTSPRIAAIYRWSPATTAKLIFGTAFRAPNDYEKFYVTQALTAKANPDLKPETVDTYEAVLEHFLRDDFRVTASAFTYRAEDLINQVQDPSDGLLVFRNINNAKAEGIDLVAQRLWVGGTRLSTSYTSQQAKNTATGQRLSNSPRHLAKFNLTTPLIGTWQAGVEILYRSDVTNVRGVTVGGYSVMNLTLVAERLAKNLELSTSVYNVFDRKYGDPASAEHFDSLGRFLNQIPQDGRSFRLKLTYRL